MPMPADVAAALSDSSHDFLRVVWPAVREVCGGGHLEVVQNDNPYDDARRLDMHGGIDAWQYLDDPPRVRGIASRVQWPAYGTGYVAFTMKAAEVNRYRYAREHGYLYPTLTIHASVSPPHRQGRLLCAGVIRTDELLDYAARYPEEVEEYKGRQPFKAFWWSRLKAAGFNVAVMR